MNGGKERAAAAALFGVSMRYLVTAAEMKEYDRFTVEEIGIPGMVLMERAALEAFRYLSEKGLVFAGANAYILAGYGNNGGDGLALARLLAEAGAHVEIGLSGDEGRATESWRAQRGILESFPVRIGKQPSRDAYDIIVDALFGVGLSRAVEGSFAEAVRELNALAGFKLALDVPSGVSSDDGRILGEVFRADATVTFAFGKRGLYLYPGCECAGEIRTADIGIGSAALREREPGMFVLEGSLRELLPARTKSGNKGSFGKALLIAGSSRMAGAAVLAGEACYRSGAGMVKVLSAPENRNILQERLPEALFGTYEDLEESLCWCDAVCIGPGLSKSGEALEVLRRVIAGGHTSLPLVIDADGINLLANEPALLRVLASQGEAGRAIALTPHMGELHRLCAALFGEGQTPDMAELKRGSAEYAMRAAEKLSVVVAAKDARTVICKKGRPVCLNIAGNSGMATAGSGDVLAGIVTALMVQGEEAFESACRGVRIHALAGDRAADMLGEHAVMAGDIAAELSRER